MKKKERIIDGTVATRKQLEKGLGKRKVRARYNTLKIFPTPFKGIYYIPFETERKAFYITNPYEILFRAAKLFLKGKPAYYGLRTALYLERKIWNPVSADIINESVSKRVEKPKEKKKKY